MANTLTPSDPLFLARLVDSLTAAGLPAVGVGVSSAQAVASPKSGPMTWHQRPEGWVRVDWSAAPTATQDSRAAAIVAAFNPAPTAEDAIGAVPVPPGVLAALCVLARPGAATAAQTAAAQKIVDAVATKALAAMTATATPGAKT